MSYTPLDSEDLLAAQADSICRTALAMEGVDQDSGVVTVDTLRRVVVASLRARPESSYPAYCENVLRNCLDVLESAAPGALGSLPTCDTERDVAQTLVAQIKNTLAGQPPIEGSAYEWLMQAEAHIRDVRDDPTAKTVQVTAGMALLEVRNAQLHLPPPGRPPVLDKQARSAVEVAIALFARMDEGRLPTDEEVDKAWDGLVNLVIRPTPMLLRAAATYEASKPAGDPERAARVRKTRDERGVSMGEAVRIEEGREIRKMIAAAAVEPGLRDILYRIAAFSRPEEKS